MKFLGFKVPNNVWQIVLIAVLVCLAAGYLGVFEGFEGTVEQADAQYGSVDTDEYVEGMGEVNEYMEDADESDKKKKKNQREAAKEAGKASDDKRKRKKTKNQEDDVPRMDKKTAPLDGSNFLNAEHHVGINMINQSLRNPNYGVRSEPTNPRKSVSPWLNSTINPDDLRRPLEIGDQC